MVIAMARGASGSALETQFDEFLFASVGEDRNEPLSVLSALARLDVDPWQMAATLAQLPRATAVQRLAALFAGLPEASLDRDALAARLLAFLPKKPASPVAAPRTSAPVPQVNAPTARLVLIYIVSLAVMLGVQALVRSHQPPPRTATAQAPAAGAVLASPRRSSAGQ